MQYKCLGLGIALVFTVGLVDTGWSCECDLNHDGTCNILDWPYFIEDWGRNDCPIP